MRVYEILKELELPKNQWELLISHADKQEVGDDLVGLVQHAYANTPQGSFVNSIKDVVPSDWKVIDWDQDPDVDACVFYRTQRGGEAWVGHKIQGVGHDGTPVSKNKSIAKVREMLASAGTWIESSDAMRHVLKKMHVPAISDEAFLQQLFKDPNLRMVDKDTYTRTLSTGETLTETVFGHPRLGGTK